VLDTGVDHTTFRQHHGIRQHGRAIVFGRRGARTDAPRGPPVGRHSTVPVGRTAAVGHRFGVDTGDCAGDSCRPGAQRGSDPATTAS